MDRIFGSLFRVSIFFAVSCAFVNARAGTALPQWGMIAVASMKSER